MKDKVNILICCTGSVATIKLPLLIETLFKAASSMYDVSIKYCLTEKALHFCSKSDVTSCSGYTDEDEWNSWKKRGDPVLHIDLSKWADILVIAPLDANTLAKLASGICDNLLLCLARAWDLRKPFIFCPAMNTKMWNHPITETQISTLKSWGYVEIPPISKVLMCGDSGVGAMAEVPDIVNVILQYIPISLAVKQQFEIIAS
uniref:Phosphopantothenoylcysteine decarboxylase n=1 Tax=Riptortus pedestris TaxID=329032 RepID=R4WDI8_RIPPE|nr:phosphopentothenoylcysteine decarboxylase [Riptortus pedestris]